MNMQIKKGFTLAELLVTLVISAVLILMVGAISQIAFSSHDQIKKESDVYSDLFYGLSRISFLARKAIELKPDPANNNTLFVDFKYGCNPNDPEDISKTCQCAFGLYPAGGGKIDFVFIPDRTKPADVEKLLRDADTMSFTVTQDLTNSPKLVTIVITGTKDKEEFKISNFVIMRRN